jgi:putative cell wall-binding protein
VVTVTPSYTTSGVTSQALVITGSYASSGLAATSFTTPTDANVVWYSVSSNTPAVTLAEPGTTAVSNMTINDPSNLPAADQLTATGSSFTVQLPTGDTWSALPTVTPFGVTIGTPTFVGGLLTIPVTSAPTGGAQITISGASVVTGAGFSYGQQKATVTVTTFTLAPTLVANASVGVILGTVNTIAGSDGTADGTVAAEFENAFPGGSSTVVLATDAAHTNGSDALAAAYLEGMLGTGLLITTPSTLGADAQAAIQREGVSTVYVLGGSLAISPTVIAQIEALPAYHAGGLVLTGSNVKVVGPIAGADGTAAGTAASISTYFGSAYGAASFPSAYNSTGGAFNDTTGSASTPPAAGFLPTAIVVASSDWQDAMTIAPEAYKMHFPVILAGSSASGTLGTDAQAALTSLGVKQVILIGGQLAVSNAVEAQIAALNGGVSVLRIAGIDATDTAAQIANFAWAAAGTGLGWTAALGHDTLLVSHADYWSDALGAAALGGGANTVTFGLEPILLVESPTNVGQYTTSELALVPTGITNLNVLGGPLAMPSSTVSTLLAGL